MVIIGPKPIPDEEPAEPTKGPNFTMRLLSFTQNFSSRNKVGQAGFGASDYTKKRNNKGNYRPYYEDEEEQFNYRNFSLRQIKDATRKFSSANKTGKEGEVDSRYFRLRQLKNATQNFSAANKLGEGGFGIVYKGILPDKTAIAVKKLSKESNQGSEEFQNEVYVLSKFKHPNLVKLLGRCIEKNQSLLVYEYMTNGSLEHAVFGSNLNLKRRLDWASRVKIWLGIAKGLAFLHDDKSKVKIVHRDIKLSNVLLDEHLNPKISDFGLVKLWEGDENITNSIVGTYGYMAPEYAMHGHVSEKIDVYSFGIVTLELLSGRQSRHSWTSAPSNESLSDLAISLVKKGDVIALLDADLINSFSVNEATLLFNLAMLCIVDSPTLRPTMSEVVSIFEGKTIMKTLTPPLEPYYSQWMRIGSERATTDISVNQLSNTLTVTKANPPRESLDAPENGVAILSSKANVDNTLPAYHGDLVSDLKESRGEGEEEDKVYIQANVATTWEPPVWTARFSTSSFSADADKMEDKGELEERTPENGFAVLSLKEEGNTLTAMHGDLVSEVEPRGGEEEEGRVLIQANVATTWGPPRWTASFSTSSFFEDAKMKDNGELEYVKPAFEEGKHQIKCSDEEFEAGCNEWKDSLVGYFLDEKEPINVDQETIEKLWKAKGNVSMFSMGNEYFLFQFNCDEDKIRVLESSDLWHIEQRPLVLRKWDWRLKFNKTEMKSLPVWVRFYNLPLFLWTSSFLSKVGSGLGIPLYVDKKTKNRERLDYAKLCIEIDASKPLPETWHISVKGVAYQLTLEYDWRPLRCTNCCTFGHVESKCRLKLKKIKQN